MTLTQSQPSPPSERVFHKYLQALYWSVVVTILFFCIAVEKIWLFPLCFVPITCGYWRLPHLLSKKMEPVVALFLMSVFLTAYLVTNYDVLMAAGYLLVAFYVALFYQDNLAQAPYSQILPLVGLMIIATFLTVELIYLPFFLIAIWLYSYLLFYHFLFRLPQKTSPSSRKGAKLSFSLRRLLLKAVVASAVLLFISIGFMLIPRSSFEININRRLSQGMETGFARDIQNRTVTNIMLQNNVFFTVRTSLRYQYFKGSVCNRYTGTEWKADLPSQLVTPKATFEGKKTYLINPDAIAAAASYSREVYRVVEYQGNLVFWRGIPQMMQFLPSWQMGDAVRRTAVGNMETAEPLTKDMIYTMWVQNQYVIPASESEASLAQTHFLQLPDLSQRVRDLSARLAQNRKNPKEIAQAVMSHLQTQYPYNLSMNPGQREWVDYFLFEAKQGYCVHFATAMAVLLRANKIPARVVAGFIGRTYDEDRGSFIVTNQDAHAWVEMYVPEEGWLHYDPTPAQEDYLTGLEFWKYTYAKVRSWWFRNVIGYSHFHQRTIYTWIKDKVRQGVGYWRYFMPCIALVIFGYYWHRYRAKKQTRKASVSRVARPWENWWRRIWAKTPATVSFYEQMLTDLKKVGIERREWETPYELEHRIAAHYPDLATNVRIITGSFCDVRFGHQALEKEPYDHVQTALTQLDGKITEMAKSLS